MSALLADYREKLDLIYVDPPFLTGRAYRSRIGRGEDSRQPAAWKTTPGYADTWQDGAAYLNMLYPRLKLMHALLSPRGSLYLHLDWHMSAYARVLLDEIFGHDRLLNEIVWVYHGPSPIRSAFKRKHDTILLYTKSDSYTFNADDVRIPYNESTLKTFASSEKAGFGKKPQLDRGKVPEDWWYFPVVARLHAERTGYPTQKPEALIERMLLASSKPGDLVADFFSGSGTTAVVASRLKRNWIACDPAPLASLTSYRRLLLHEPMPLVKWLRAEPIGQPALVLDASARTENSRTVVRLRDGKAAAGQPLTFPGELVLWEVGTSTEGGAMNVIAWSVRDFRAGELAHEIAFDAVTDGSDLRLRAYDCYGRWGECKPALESAPAK
jgi:DNA modification methylase